MRFGLGTAQHGVHQLRQVLALGVALARFDGEEDGAVVAEFGQKDQVREAQPEDGLERPGLLRHAAVEEAGDHQVELAVAAQRRGHQPVGQRPVAAVGDLGKRKGGEVRPLEHLVELARLRQAGASAPADVFCFFKRSAPGSAGAIATLATRLSRGTRQPPPVLRGDASRPAQPAAAGRRPVRSTCISPAMPLQLGDAVFDIAGGSRTGCPCAAR